MNARDLALVSAALDAAAKECEKPLTNGDIWNGIEITDDGRERGPTATDGEKRAAKKILIWRACAIRALDPSTIALPAPEGDERDGERYRWLRDYSRMNGTGLAIVEKKLGPDAAPSFTQLCSDAADTAVDTAMSRGGA